MTSANCPARFGLAGLVGGAALSLCLPAMAGDVTYDRLLKANAEPQNWLMTYLTYDSHRDSPLSQINRSNVANLRPRFAVGLGRATGVGVPLGQSIPLVDEGLMWATTGRAEVIAIDVRRGSSGQVLWRYDPKVEGDYLRNRGVAMLGNNVYVTMPDRPRMISLDRMSGDVVWDINTGAADYPPNQRHAAAPLAVKDMMVIAQSNGSAGNRAWIGAFKADGGKLA